MTFFFWFSNISRLHAIILPSIIQSEFQYFTLIDSSLTLDYSNASSDVQDINTLLQNLLDNFYPSWDGSTLYDNGNQYTNITGGWEDYPLAWGNGYTVKPATFTDTTIGLICNESNKNVAVTTKNAIDLTEYNHLKVEYVQNISNNGSPVIIVKQDKTSYGNTANVAKIEMGSGTSIGSLDISSLSGLYYPYIEVDNLRSVTIKKVYLSK